MQKYRGIQGRETGVQGSSVAKSGDGNSCDLIFERERERGRERGMDGWMEGGREGARARRRSVPRILHMNVCVRMLISKPFTL